MANYVVDLKSVSKRFRRATRSKGGYTTVKSSLISFFRRKHRQENYTAAIKDLTLRIPQGASTGIIGRNGSGKSTLLKIITGIYRADEGVVSVQGRIAALIELGAGFHPDFTGRKNLFFGGIMHGLSRSQIEGRFEQIVKFAELEDVIDDPVRTYSSGMYMRLGFSLAVHVDPDILLIDEVLAVGDEGFIAKCKDRINELRKEGKTLLLVTHDLAAVERWCDEVLWIDQGVVRERGEPRRVIDAYRTFIERGEEQELREAPVVEEVAAEPLRWGSREVEITDARILDRAGQDHLVFHPQDQIAIEWDYRINEAQTDVVFGIGLHRADGFTVFGTNTQIEDVVVPILNKSGSCRFVLERLGLADGAYTLDLAVHRSDGYPYDYHRSLIHFSVRSPVKTVGVLIPEHRWEFLAEQKKAVGHAS